MADKHVPVVGYENLVVLINRNGYSVDRNAYPDCLLSDRFLNQNVVFIRLRRLGMNINMSMIKAFCESDCLNPGDNLKQQRFFIDNGHSLAVAKVKYKERRDRGTVQIPAVSV